MRRLFTLLTTGFLVLGMAGVASAAVLNWEGTSRTYLADYPPGVLYGGGIATINSSAGVIPAHLSTWRPAESRGQIHGTFTRYVTDPEVLANGVYALIYDDVGGGTGTHTGISGGVASTSTGPGGQTPIHGVTKICLLSTACTIYLPMYLSQPTTGGGLNAVGVGGLLTSGGYGGIRISLQAAPWTVKTATVLDQITPTAGPPRILETWTAHGWAHGPASGTTSTAQVNGMVQFVTPSQITTNLPLGSSDKQGSFVIVTYRFIPEPGLVLLIASGVAGLAFLGRRRLRK